MALPKTYLSVATMFLCLMSSQQTLAFSLDPFQLIESQLLRIIDEEFLRVADEPENLVWTEDYGVQPTDGYELDYAEKCALIASFQNQKALAACATILTAN